MREDIMPDMAKRSAGTVAQRSRDIRVVVRLRRGMQGQTEDEVHLMEPLLGRRLMSVFQRNDDVGKHPETVD